MIITHIVSSWTNNSITIAALTFMALRPFGRCLIWASRALGAQFPLS